ncbi:MAG: 50S ribosomal protein L28 [Chlamydiales bacterium]|nr:50S ribosomal protein L28 [Chlamydiales bacterium]
MSKKCQITGKIPRRGKTYTKRGIAKKKKGIGLNITGCTKRRFLPNLMKKRFWFPEEERFVTIKVSANGLRILDKKGISEIVAQLRLQGQRV